MTDKIPAVRFDEAKQNGFGKIRADESCNPYDLEPEEEALIGQLLQRRARMPTDFVFVTHYPSQEERDVLSYAMDDPADAKLYVKL